MAKTELATVEDFKIVTGMEAMDEELKAELEDELDDLDDDGGIDAKHIKIPSGGGVMFEIPGENPEEPDTVKTFSAVILYQHSLNAYYQSEYQGGSNPPDCGSFDGHHGEGNPGGSCDSCPLNQYGSGKNGAKA